MITPQKYMKKPVTVEAMCFTTNNEEGSPTMDAIVNWINQGKSADALALHAWHNGTNIFLQTPLGMVTVIVGDYLIKTASGDFHSCDPRDFDGVYQPC